MTFAIGHVDGGSNAGRRIVKPTPKPWTCECRPEFATIGGATLVYSQKLQPAYMSRCNDCGTRRDG